MARKFSRFFSGKGGARTPEGPSACKAGRTFGDRGALRVRQYRETFISPGAPVTR